MSPPDSRHGDDRFDPRSDAFAGVHALPDDVPLTDELCLFVVSLRLDDRELPPALAARVDAHLAERPELRRAADDFVRHHELLAEGPAVSVPEGFADRVLAARDAQPAVDVPADGMPAAEAPATAVGGPRPLPLEPASPAPAAARPTLRRLAAAAALLLAVSLGWDLAHPVDTLADPDTARGRWIVDELQPDPFGPARIDAALRARLPGPLDAEPSADPGRTADAPAPETESQPEADADAPPADTEPPR